MRRLVVVSAFTLLFLAAGGLLVPGLVPLGLVYDQRLGYECFRDNHSDLDVVIREIKEEVRREGLTGYVFLLGDSVAYSARSAPSVSIAAEMERVSRATGRPVRVFCLAQPSMQIGDVYVVILKLQHAGLDTSRVVCNLLYGGFVARTPYPPVVFWLEKELARLDPAAYALVKDHLEQARLDPLLRPAANPAAEIDRWAARTLYPLIPPLAYRDFIWSAAVRLVTGQDPKSEAFDPRPWTEKGHLPETLRQPEYQNAFSDAPFILDESNPEVYFLGKILEATEGGQVVLFLSPVNQVLMKDNVSKPGYRENVARVGEWFRARGAEEAQVSGPEGLGPAPGGAPAQDCVGAVGGGRLTYLNLENAVPDGLFADHLHLTGEGHRYLAEILWRSLEPGFNEGGA